MSLKYTHVLTGSHYHCGSRPSSSHTRYCLRDCSSVCSIWAFLVVSLVKNQLAMWETQVRSLGREDPLEKEMATHSSTLAWRIPWREEPGRLQSMGSHRVGHDWATSLSLSFTFILYCSRFIILFTQHKTKNQMQKIKKTFKSYRTVSWDTVQYPSTTTGHGCNLENLQFEGSYVRDWLPRWHSW